LILISLVFLFVYLFGAYAYGAATVYGLWEMSPLWGESSRSYAPLVRKRIDRAGLALFAISTVWFVVALLMEFRNFIGFTREGWLDLAQFIVFLFPPVIMHTVYLESHREGEPPAPAIYRYLLAAMYFVAPVMGIWMVGAIYDWAPYPKPFEMFIGVTIGALFTLIASIQRDHAAPPAAATHADQLKLRNVMVAGFVGMSAIFITMIFLREQRLVLMVLERVSRSAPLFFMIASIYFENRFEFYDLVVKRALLLLLSVVVVGVSMAATLPFLDALPGGMARPWLFAVALAPLAMVMPWLMSRTERLLDRLWLGREFTPVEP
jgi:hypothetical protein